MRLFAIADLHLAQTVDKPMDVFGPRWDRHVERICRNWEETVEENDTVLVGGDISWAGSLDQARSDLELLHRLPGRKILLRGNHDYWWTTVRKMQDFCQTHGFSSLEFLRNDARLEAGFWVCGTRGWVLPPDEAFREEDEKIFRREVLRLDLSLADLERQRRAGESPGPALALMHYPPLSEKGCPSELSEKLSKAGIAVCLFGHIHHHVPYYEGRPLLDGVRYIMVASDQIGFRPLLIGEAGRFLLDGGEDNA